MDNLLTIQRAQPALPCTVVIFGASGDLAKRKLIPALYNLLACGQGMLPPQSAVLGFARREMSLDDFRKSAHDWTTKFSRLKVDESCWATFADGLDYLSGLDRLDGFTKLKAKLEAIENARGLPPNRVYYLAIPPEAIGESVEGLTEGRSDRGADCNEFHSRRRRKADRPRSAERARSQSHAGQVSRRAADFPHRPLPRQGNRAEPAGAALLE